MKCLRVKINLNSLNRQFKLFVGLSGKPNQTRFCRSRQRVAALARCNDGGAAIAKLRLYWSQWDTACLTPCLRFKFLTPRPLCAAKQIALGHSCSLLHPVGLIVVNILIAAVGDYCLTLEALPASFADYLTTIRKDWFLCACTLSFTLANLKSFAVTIV